MQLLLVRLKLNKHSFRGTDGEERLQLTWWRREFVPFCTHTCTWITNKHGGSLFSIYCTSWFSNHHLSLWCDFKLHHKQWSFQPKTAIEQEVDWEQEIPKTIQSTLLCVNIEFVSTKKTEQDTALGEILENKEHQVLCSQCLYELLDLSLLTA